MHDVPAHASKFNKDFLASKNIKEERLKEWPPCSSDLNCIERLWSIMKSDLYQGGKQYSSKDHLWDAIMRVSNSISPSVISKLIQFMHDRLVSVIEAKGHYINMRIQA